MATDKKNMKTGDGKAGGKKIGDGKVGGKKLRAVYRYCGRKTADQRIGRFWRYL